jgi:xanthosine utilization system XapX-like protein
VSYALAAAIPLSLWAISRPLPGAVAVVAVGGLFVAARRVRRLVRCLRDCRGFAVDLFGSVRITVAQVPVDGD